MKYLITCLFFFSSLSLLYSQNYNLDTTYYHYISFEKFDTILNSSKEKYLDELYNKFIESDVLKDFSIVLFVYEYKEEYYSDDLYGFHRAKNIIFYFQKKYKLMPYNFVIFYYGFTGEEKADVWFGIMPK